MQLDGRFHGVGSCVSTAALLGNMKLKPLEILLQGVLSELPTNLPMVSCVPGLRVPGPNPL